MSIKIYPMKDITELISQEYERLKGKKPRHPLLKYIKNSDSGFELTKYDAFIEKFELMYDKKNKHLQMEKILSNYYHHLRSAVDEVEGIDRSKGPNTYAMMKSTFNSQMAR